VTQTLASPTAIDAFVRIEAIKVVGRHRKDLGDLSDLVASISDVDLLNPVTLTRDGRLVAGERRLEACRRLGWVEVPVRFVDSLDDAAKLLHAERDENLCRKDMLPSELASLGEALYGVAADDAKARQHAHISARDEHGRIASSALQSGTGDGSGIETATVVGEALGMSRSTYGELRHIYKAATDADVPEHERTLAKAALDRIDRGAGIQPTVRDFRQLRRARQEAQEAKAAVLAESEDPAWTPDPKDRSYTARERREEILRLLAASGYTSEQIAARLGQRAGHIRGVARELGVTITADAAMGVRTRKTIDSNRVVRETAIALEGLAMGVQLVNINDLDPAEIDGWASSIAASIRTLNRLGKQLKEKRCEVYSQTGQG
jgi:ParB-like chromosome segregation protein Spo0J